MLRFLAVRHLAVIDQLEVEFEPGLNILTGETGAGKTVLVEAIDLLVGARASADFVRTGATTAVVQAIFERADGRDVIVRREISSEGRSRAFIDDALATTTALRELGATLVDLHGQHEHQALLDPAEHLDVVDGFGRHLDRVAETGLRFDAWKSAAATLDRVRLDDREKRARMEIAAFHLEEIAKVAPLEGEDAQLSAERTVLANADRLNRLSAEAYAALYEGDGAALAGLAAVWRRVAELAALDPRFAPYLAERDELKLRLEELAFFLRSYSANLEASPVRLQDVEDRLAAIERLKKKHGPQLSDVLARQRALGEELELLASSEERVAALVARELETRRAFEESARALSVDRQHTARDLGRQLERALADLAMPKARAEIRMTQSAEPETWTRRGLDRAEFFFSPNPGEDVRPLARIASGGELSRVMLALRTLGAPAAPGRTLVFDEVDAGIGGAAADAVGARLHELARQYQVLCITHLPQIAARPGVHFAITKEIRAGRTLTDVTRLDQRGREGEIARMIAGATPSVQVLASARELIAGRLGAGEAKAKGESERRAAAKLRGRRRGA
jgi:DNA repair protein RecN (Recombination protein N)